MVAAGHGDDAAEVFAVGVELAFEVADPAVGGVGAAGGHAALDDEAGDDAVEGGVVEPAGGGEFEEVADVFGGPGGFEGDFEGAEGGFEFDGAGEFGGGGGEEGFDLFGFDGDGEDFDGLGGEVVGAGGGLGDFFDDVHAFGDVAEGGEFAVEGGLGADADEELGAAGVGFAGDADGGDGAAFVFEVGELVGEEVKAAGAPEVAGCFGGLEEGVAALDDAVGDDAEEGGAVEVALAGAGEELVDVFGGFAGVEGEAEDAGVGGDDGFEVGRGLGLEGEGGEEEGEGAHVSGRRGGWRSGTGCRVRSRGRGRRRGGR